MKEILAYKKNIVKETNDIKGKPIIESLILTGIILLLIGTPIYLIYRYLLIQFCGVNIAFLFIMISIGLIVYIIWALLETIYYISILTLTKEEHYSFGKLFLANLLNWILFIVLMVSVVVIYFIFREFF